MSKKRHPKGELYMAERKKGKTYAEIARMYGVTAQNVSICCAKYDPCRFRPFTEKNCVYPNLRRWLNENRVSKSEFIRRMELLAVGMSHDTYRNYFLGLRYPTKPIIDKMLKVTGMTYEELFYREDEGDEWE